ncbi:hypothetical protein AWC32_05755 [Mycobacterium xenopi]|nr:hypothetical protein AWC32_05755 [Mycobacterium xenopi]SPX93634.1 Uncharacterised protein [Mycobacterium xenopi]
MASETLRDAGSAMHVHPIAFAILAAVLGVALAFVLIQQVRRGDNAQRRLRIVLYVLPVLAAVWLAVDFIITPQDRWVNGIALTLAALVTVGGFGYDWLRRSKARPGR